MRPSTEPDASPLDAPPGRCRAGLEEWVGEVAVDPPAVLLEHARVLADEVDAHPDDSPLHGRLTTVVAALIETVDERAADEAAVVHRRLDGGCSVPGHKFGPMTCRWCADPASAPSSVSQSGGS